MEINNVQRQYQALCRAVEKRSCELSLYSFVKYAWHILEPNTPFQEGWHLEIMCKHLEAVSRFEIQRLIINVPPRHCKSLLLTFWNCWHWIQNPSDQYISASYSASLSNRDNTKVGRILQSKWFESKWDIGLTRATPTIIENKHRGHRYSVGTTGSLTGFGGDLLVCDDPLNVNSAQSDTVRNGTNEWFNNVLSTRLNNPKRGAIVIVQQRSHSKDLVGYLVPELDKITPKKNIERDETDKKEWEIVCLPARYEGTNRIETSLNIKDPRTKIGEPLWPERYGDKELKALEESLGIYGTSAQLQQRPTPKSGGMFSDSSFILVDNLPSSATQTVRFFDLAGGSGSDTSDYTASVRMSYEYPYIYIEHVEHHRKSPYATREAMRDRAEADKQEMDSLGRPHMRYYIEIEPGASSKHYVQQLISETLTDHIARGFLVQKSKTFFIDMLSAKAEAGLVKMIRAPWNEMFTNEANSYPLGKKDDMIDAAAKGCYQMRDHIKSKVYEREELAKRRNKNRVRPLKVSFA